MSGQTISIPERRSRVPRGGGIERLLRTARVVHPFPTLLNVVATGGLALVAAHGMPDRSVLVRMLLLMLCAQSAIGITNDYFDRELDAATKPWKPVASGLISPRAALVVALCLIGATGTLGLSLGAGSFLLAMAGLASGLAYDVRLKRTMFSALPYMAGITILPLWVWVTVGQWDAALWWLLPLGSLIGLALHLANTVPDIEGDSMHGVEGLAHRLGAERSTYVAWGSFAGALGISALLAPVLGYDLLVYVPAAVVGAACLAASIGLYALKRQASALQFGFGALSIGAVVLAGGWLAALS